MGNGCLVHVGRPSITLAWFLVAGWYVIFGLLVGPVPVIRRSQRKRKLEEARHSELLETVKQRKS